MNDNNERPSFIESAILIPVFCLGLIFTPLVLLYVAKYYLQ
jgi:hypothetical protein